jgi:hypothetical protein
MTADTVELRARTFATEILDKTVIRSQGRAGFVVDSLLVPYILAAVRMLDSCFASAEVRSVVDSPGPRPALTCRATAQIAYLQIAYLYGQCATLRTRSGGDQSAVWALVVAAGGW